MEAMRRGPATRSGRFLGLVLAWVLIAAGVHGELPEIRTKTLQNLQEAEQGITKPTIADRNGHRYVLKANSQTMLRGNVAIKYGNFETELIAFQIFQLLGLPSPEVRVVRMEGKPDLHLRIRFADASFTHGAAPAPVNRTGIAEGEPIDLDAGRKIALVDLLLGNPDRHDGNVLVYKNAAGVWMPIPIDHNFALITAETTGVPAWALKPIPGADAQPDAIVPYGDTYLTHTHRNTVEERALAGAEGEAGLKQLAERLKTELTDEAITKMLRSIPPEAIVGREPTERFAELGEMLRTRRDAIPSFLDRFFAGRRD